MSIYKVIVHLLKNLNIGITTYDNLNSLNTFKNNYRDLEGFSENRLQKLAELYSISNAQLSQDLFVLHELDFKKDGFFVEFGATNGKDLSNTYLLEKKFNWKGILAEPAKNWHLNLEKNRDCNIDKNCVWIDSYTCLKFHESDTKELSTIQNFAENDIHHKKRSKGQTYDVQSISLLDLLDKYDAPRTIDYLSIDTEGSEYEILSNFDFTKYNFRIITCEHNYTTNRDKIKVLLEKNGYKRKFIGISKFDDWYVQV